MASRGPRIVCDECGEDVRLYSLIENDGMVIGCGCQDVGHSVDAMPYEMGVSHTSDDWRVAEQPDEDPDPPSGPNATLTDGGLYTTETDHPGGGR